MCEKPCYPSGVFPTLGCKKCGNMTSFRPAYEGEEERYYENINKDNRKKINENI